MVNKRLQDGLRDLVESGLQKYCEFVDTLCPESVQVNAIDEVIVKEAEDGRTGPSLLTMQLVLVDIEEEQAQDEEPAPAPADGEENTDENASTAEAQAAKEADAEPAEDDEGAE